MKNIFIFLDKHLSKSGKYICGDNFTIVDLLIFHETTNVEALEYSIKHWEHLSAWYERVLEHKGVK